MLLPHDVAGAGAPPLLLIPGANGHRRWMSPLAAALGPACRTIAVTLPGEPEAPAPGGRPGGLEEITGGLLATLDACSAERAILVGTSLGGVAALRLARDHPGRVAGLVLHATTARPAHLLAPYRRVLPHPLLCTLVFNARLLPALPAELRAAGGARPGEGRRLRRHLLALRRRVPYSPVAFGARLGSLAGVDLTAELPRIAAPALVLSSAPGLDPIIGPEEGEWIARHLPGARHQVLPGAGHLAPLLLPGRLAGVILEFVAGASVNRS